LEFHLGLVQAFEFGLITGCLIGLIDHFERMQ